MKYLGVFSVVMVLLVGCATVVSTGYEVTVSKISEVNVSDGVDRWTWSISTLGQWFLRELPMPFQRRFGICRDSPSDKHRHSTG